MRKIVLAIIATLPLAACASLTAQQQAALDDIAAMSVSAACAKAERQFAKVGSPTQAQLDAMDAARAGCADPAAAVATVRRAVADVLALIPTKAVKS